MLSENRKIVAANENVFCLLFSLDHHHLLRTLNVNTPEHIFLLFSSRIYVC